MKIEMMMKMEMRYIRGTVKDVKNRIDRLSLVRLFKTKYNQILKE
jgi:hypothetical protein